MESAGISSLAAFGVALCRRFALTDAKDRGFGPDHLLTAFFGSVLLQPSPIDTCAVQYFCIS
jgi:hypothetical protein